MYSKEGWERISEFFFSPLSLTCLISDLRIRQDLGLFTAMAGVHLDF
jgi:hypothetical protein